MGVGRVMVGITQSLTPPAQQTKPLAFFTHPNTMQALSLLHLAIEALDREVTALAGLTDTELQELCDLIEALQEHKRKIRDEAGRRELTAQNFLIRSIA